MFSPSSLGYSTSGVAPGVGLTTGAFTQSGYRDWLTRHLSSFEISRVGDITDLDTLGVPVWFATRPNARSLSVSQGKGLDETSAWISAVAESIEAAVAERDTFIAIRDVSCLELASQGRTLIDLSRQARCAVSRVDLDQPMAWVEGKTWGTDATVYAPYELIGMDMRLDQPWDRHAFRMSSNGLACHFDLQTAIAHGLRELIEDDAYAASIGLGNNAKHLRKFRLGATQIEWLVPGLSTALDRAGLAMEFTRIDRLVDLPVVSIELIPNCSNQEIRTATGGCACAMTEAQAARAALLEAVQSRLTLIAGSRDDISLQSFTPSHFESSNEPKILPEPFVDWEIQSECQSTELEIQTLAAKLNQSGIPDFHVFELTSGVAGINVVRVLADDLLSSATPPNAPHSGRFSARFMQAWRMS
jgi:ribosomal protein S12 methylthiotransferase accessory factor